MLKASLTSFRPLLCRVPQPWLTSGGLGASSSRSPDVSKQTVVLEHPSCRQASADLSRDLAVHAAAEHPEALETYWAH